jgi:transcriptional regulator with XRE-family HTH domain
MFPDVSLASSLLFPHDERVTKGDELRDVGRAVAARRGELGMTQQGLADAAGVDLKTVYNLESGGRWPIARTRVAIAAALGWEGDALAAIAGGTASPGTGSPPTSMSGNPLGVEITPEQLANMEPHLNAIRTRAGIARRQHPGERLTGEMVFGALEFDGIIFPASPRDAGKWNDLSAVGWPDDAVAWGVAAFRAWASEQSARESAGEGNAAGLTALSPDPGVRRELQTRDNTARK